MVNVTFWFIWMGLMVSWGIGIVACIFAVVMLQNYLWRRLKRTYDLVLVGRVLRRLKKRGLLKGQYGD